MTWEYGPFVIPLALSATLSAIVALGLWPRRRMPGGKALIALLCATAWWSLTELLQYGAQELGAKVFFTNLVYLSVVSAAVFWFLFSLTYSRKRERLRISETISLWVIPVLSLVFLWAAPTDGLMLRIVSLDPSGPVTNLVMARGPWFWVMTAYSYALMLWGAVLLVRLVRQSGRAMGVQALFLVTGLVLPWASNVVWLLGSYRWFPFDPTSIAFGASAILLTVGMRWSRLFDLVPSARSAAIEAMRDGWLVVDTAARLVDLNAAGRTMLGGGDLVGRRLDTLVPQLLPMLRGRMDATVRDETVVLGSGSQSRHYMVEASAVTERSGVQVGRVITLRDVTRSIEAQQERERLIQALQDALSQVRELGGLLPICAHCKRIRDDQGYWTQLERYISQHTKASFTHGFCPDCLERMMQEAGLGEHEELSKGDLAWP